MVTKERPRKPTPEDARCPISYAMPFLGDRWSLLLIRDMLLFGKRRYSEFLDSPEGISTNILANRLQQMQRLALVAKYPDPGNGKMSAYLPTDKGMDLYPILLEIIRWGLAHDMLSMVSAEMKAALQGDGVALGEQIRQRLRDERTALQQQ